MAIQKTVISRTTLRLNIDEDKKLDLDGADYIEYDSDKSEDVFVMIKGARFYISTDDLTEFVREVNTHRLEQELQSEKDNV